MPRWLKIILGFIAGLIAGEGAAILGYIIATNFFGVFDRDGGGAMGAVFILGPALALLGGIAAAITTAVITRKQ